MYTKDSALQTLCSGDRSRLTVGRLVNIKGMPASTMMTETRKQRKAHMDKIGIIRQSGGVMARAHESVCHDGRMLIEVPRGKKWFGWKALSVVRRCLEERHRRRGECREKVVVGVS